MTPYTLFETEFFTVCQAGDYRVPGYVIVLSKADCTSLSDFTPKQTADLHQCLALAEKVVQRILQPERIYIMKFGEVNPRVHFHVFPRTERIGDAYAAQVPDEKPYNGAKLVDWIWSHHASLGFTDEDIQYFVAQAREIL